MVEEKLAAMTEEEEETEIAAEGKEAENDAKRNMKERKVSWAKLGRSDSLNVEAGRVSMSHAHSSKVRIAYFACSRVFRQLSNSFSLFDIPGFQENIALSSSVRIS